MDSADTAPWQVRRVEDYIAAHLDGPFTVEEAVAITGFSARTLYRAFRKYRGYSPGEFSKQRRLLKARDLLRAAPPFRSVTEVAEECGFFDLSHFSRDFSKQFGEWPSAAKRIRK